MPSNPTKAGKDSYFIPPFKNHRKLTIPNPGDIISPGINIQPPDLAIPPISIPKAAINVNPETPHFHFPCEINKSEMDKIAKIESLARLIPEFNGNPDELLKFISCVDRVHDQCTQDSERNLLVDFILFKLGSKVYNIIANTKPNTWVDIKSQLSRVYQVEDTFDDIERRISSLKFEPLFESFHEFSMRTSNLVEKYQKLLITQCKVSDGVVAKSIAEKRIIPRFVIGLPESIRNFVRIHQSESLAKCVEVAAQQLNFERSLYDDMNHSRIGISNRQPDFQTPPLQKTQIKFCRYCKRNGHIIQECRTKRRNDSRIPQAYPGYTAFIPQANPSQSFQSNMSKNQSYYSHPQYQNRIQTPLSQVPQNAQRPENSMWHPQHSQSISWQNPVAVSTPTKNSYGRNQPYNPANSIRLENITNSLRDLNLADNKSLNKRNAQVNHYVSEEVGSENCNGLENALERSDA